MENNEQKASVSLRRVLKTIMVTSVLLCAAAVAVFFSARHYVSQVGVQVFSTNTDAWKIQYALEAVDERIFAHWFYSRNDDVTFLISKARYENGRPRTKTKEALITDVNAWWMAKGFTDDTLFAEKKYAAAVTAYPILVRNYAFMAQIFPKLPVYDARSQALQGDLVKHYAMAATYPFENILFGSGITAAEMGDINYFRDRWKRWRSEAGIPEYPKRATLLTMQIFSLASAFDNVTRDMLDVSGKLYWAFYENEARASILNEPSEFRTAREETRALNRLP